MDSKIPLINYLRKFIYLTSVIYAITFQSCISLFDKSDNLKFDIQNNSDSAIYIYVTQSETLQLTPRINLFDTLKINGMDSIKSPVYRINAYSFYVDFENNVGSLYFDYFRKNDKDSTLQVFFFKEAIIKSYTWESICRKKLYSKKITITEKQLRVNNCVIY